MCRAEAVGLPDKTEEFLAENPDIPFDYFIIVHEDYYGDLPNEQTAADYADSIDNPVIPVTADLTDEIVDATPWNGNTLPGKCAMSPEMEILDCYVGEDDSEGFDAIVADFEAR